MVWPFGTGVVREMKAMAANYFSISGCDQSGSVHELDSASVPCRLAALIDGGIREALPNLDYSGREWVCLSRITQMRICDGRISV